MATTFFGCASVEKRGPVPISLPPVIIPSEPGMYHSVRKGETLWRISRVYGVSLDALAQCNKIETACAIEIGQKIFIPDSLRSFATTKKTARPDAGAVTEFIWPCRGEIISCYNQLRQNVKNQGIDIGARPGGAVCTAASGNVVFTSDSMRGYGKTIIIQHPGGFTTTYANNQENLVKTGDYVTRGQSIAKAGASGRAVQCLVHFEIRKNNKPQNPLLYLP